MLWPRLARSIGGAAARVGRLRRATAVAAGAATCRGWSLIVRGGVRREAAHAQVETSAAPAARTPVCATRSRLLATVLCSARIAAPRSVASSASSAAGPSAGAAAGAVPKRTLRVTTAPRSSVTCWRVVRAPAMESMSGQRSAATVSKPRAAGCRQSDSDCENRAWRQRGSAARQMPETLCILPSMAADSVGVTARRCLTCSSPSTVAESYQLAASDRCTADGMPCAASTRVSIAMASLCCILSSTPKTASRSSRSSAVREPLRPSQTASARLISWLCRGMQQSPSLMTLLRTAAAIGRRASEMSAMVRPSLVTLDEAPQPSV